MEAVTLESLNDYVADFEKTEGNNELSEVKEEDEPLLSKDKELKTLALAQVILERNK